jgi:hypothetical protein
MKVLSLNFLTCAVKACKSSSDSYPLHPQDAELVQDEIELNPDMLINVLPRLDWTALRMTSSEVGGHFSTCEKLILAMTVRADSNLLLFLTAGLSCVT